MRRPSLLVLSAAATALLVAGCGGETETSASETLPAISEIDAPSEVVELTYHGGAIPEERAKKIIEAFEAEHPTIRVTYQSVPYDSYNSTLGSRFERGDVDIFDVDQTGTAAFAVRGWQADLSTVFAEKLDQIDDAALVESTYDGALYNLPYQIGSAFLYYNKEVLDEVGAEHPSSDPAEIPTWEWIRDVGLEAVDSGAAAYGLTVSTPQFYYYVQPFAESLGGGPGGSDDGLTPDIANDAWVEALTFYGDLYADGVAPRGLAGGQTAEAFANGDSAFFYGGIWNSPTITANEDLDFGIAQAPKFADGEPVTTSGGWALGINPQSSAEKQQAAAVFLDWFLFGDDGGFVGADAETENVPSTADTRAVFWENDVYNDERLTGVREITDYSAANFAKPRIQSPGYTEFDDITWSAFEDIINGADPRETLTAANEQIAEAWAQYR